MVRDSIDGLYVLHRDASIGQGCLCRGNRAAYLCRCADWIARDLICTSGDFSTGVLLHNLGNGKQPLIGIFEILATLSGVFYLFIDPDLFSGRALSSRPEISSGFISRTIASNAQTQR